MPLPKGTRYRVTRRGGKRIRLAFAPGAPRKGATPIEAKNLETGATHTPAEMRRDRARRRSVKRPKGRF